MEESDQIKILVVDDVPTNLDVLRPPLEQAGYRFLAAPSGEMGIEAPGLAPDGIAALEAYDFPGNVRELKNIAERALIESGGGDIERSHLHFIGGTAPTAEAQEVAGDEMPEDLQQATYLLVKRVLARTEGNVSAAAQRLGIHRSSIYRIMAQEDTGFDKL